MRKLTPIEENAYAILQREGSVLIGDGDLMPDAHAVMTRVFDSLVRKKRAVVEATDAGPRYHAA